jgi:hypothetical protein
VSPKTSWRAGHRSRQPADHQAARVWPGITDDWDDWDDNNLILFGEFCELIRTPQRTVRDWRRRGIGPRRTRFQGVGRLYITVAEARRFLASATLPAYRCGKRAIRIKLEDLEATPRQIP